MKYPLLPALGALLVTTRIATAQIVVVDGDDLPAVVAAAPTGSVVEIDSDGTFDGQVVIGAGKDLVLRAAPGRSPILDGDALPDVLIETGHATVRLEGLRLLYTNGWGRAVSVTGADFLPGEVLTLEVVDCELVGDLHLYPKGPGLLDLDAAGLEISSGGFTTLQAFGSAIDLDAIDCTLEDITTDLQDDCEARLRLEDCVVSRDSHLRYAQSTYLVELVRCHVQDGVTLEPSSWSAPTAAPQPRLYAVSSLFEGEGFPWSTGIRLEDPSAWGGLELELLGCTVTGQETGIVLPATPQAPGVIHLRNTLLADNATDLTGVAAGAVFVRNLAEDVDLGPGNLHVMAQLDADLALLPSSPGTDDGLGAGIAPGATDLLGGPRVADVDCDGVAEISIGAIEVPPSLLASATTVTGGNPAGTQTGPPVVGQLLDVQVDLDASGLLGLAAVGAPLSTPLPIPGWKGSLLIDPGSFFLYATATGNLKLPVPLDYLLLTL